MPSTIDRPQGLHVYLSDHRAGASAGLARARRAASANRDSDFGRVMEELAVQLASDVDSLDRILDELAVHASVWKRTLALVVERVGRLKRNGYLVRRAPVSRVLEIELLMGGIDAKRSLWRSLRTSFGDDVRSVDLDELIDRAGDQRARLRELHPRAALAAFADVGDREHAAHPPAP